MSRHPCARKQQRHHSGSHTSRYRHPRQSHPRRVTRLFVFPEPPPTKSPPAQSARSTHTSATGSETNNPESTSPSDKSRSPAAPKGTAPQPSPPQSTPSPTVPHTRTSRLDESAAPSSSTAPNPYAAIRGCIIPAAASAAQHSANPRRRSDRTLLLHLKSRRQKLERTHQRQQHTWSRDTPRRHIRVHQHQRSPRDRHRHPHRRATQPHHSSPRATHSTAPPAATPQTTSSKTSPDAPAAEPLHTEVRLTNQPRHRRRKQRIPQMPHHKLRPMRIQPRIEQPLDLRQIHPAILCIRMVATHQHRKKRQCRHQHSRKTSFPPVLFAFEPLRRDGCC